MSEGGSGERTVLNWRGPLLAGGIFAVVFAVLLLMAQRNQSNASDMGSSLREDPYGTSLVFDAYKRAGYQVIRSQDQDSLMDLNATNATAFFIGGAPAGDWKLENGKIRVGRKMLAKLDVFLSRGGRVVLIDPQWALMSDASGWEVRNEWEGLKRDSQPIWVTPSTGPLPADAESIYLARPVPGLKTDEQWTALYASADADPAESPRVYMAMRSVGRGELVAASQQSFLLNEVIKTHPNPALLDFLAGGRPVIWVDETLHGLYQQQGVIWLVQRYKLQASLMLFWVTLLVLLWSMGGDLLQRPKPSPNSYVVRQGEGAGVAARRLLQRSVAKADVAMECWEQFRRRSPQDAQAISADPKSNSRLRAAFGQPPLAGYKELSRLIGERRAAARRLAQTRREQSKSFASSSGTKPEEALIG
jgi:uncharacterized protein DUF4350